MSQSALSQHLARLREDELVATRRESQTIYYSLASDHVSRLIGLLYELYCAPARETTTKQPAQTRKEGEPYDDRSQVMAFAGLVIL